MPCGRFEGGGGMCPFCTPLGFGTDSYIEIIIEAFAENSEVSHLTILHLI